ncbi:MAG: GNAT family N-acetyltransferase [Clostridia bacterium]|nr:GNAT family N-acetyltransferase [Clostridia bacterium]
MEIRQYTGRDFPALLSLWNRALPHDPVTREMLMKKLIMDPNFRSEGLLICTREAAMIGFINAVCRRIPAVPGDASWEHTGYIPEIAVSPGADEEAVGGLLLDAAGAYLRDQGKTRATTAYPPLYFTQGVERDAHPGLVRAFLSRGYHGVPSVAKELDLDAYRELPDIENRRRRLAKEGYEVVTLTDGLAADVLDADAPFSSANWSEEFRGRLSVNMDFGSMRVAVRHTPDGDRVVGACIFGDPNSDACRFGPFGVSSEERGKGIGSVLLADTLNEMKRRGLPRAWMQWADESGPAHTVYTRVGFRIVKRYLTFSGSL